MIQTSVSYANLSNFVIKNIPILIYNNGKTGYHKGLSIYIYGKRIYKSKYDGSLFSIYNISGDNFDVIIKIDKGMTNCPDSYKIMYIGKNGYNFSKDFGTCFYSPSIKYDNSKLIFKFKLSENILVPGKARFVGFEYFFFKKWILIKKTKSSSNNKKSILNGNNNKYKECKNISKASLLNGLVRPTIMATGNIGLSKSDLSVKSISITNIGFLEKNNLLNCRAHGDIKYLVGKEEFKWSGFYNYTVNSVYSNGDIIYNPPYIPYSSFIIQNKNLIK